MKIYVSVDMEGIAGIALPEQLKRTGFNGDDATCREAEATLSGVTVYETKQAVGRHAALMKPPQRVRQEIRQAVQEAISNRVRCKPYITQGPYELVVRYASTDMVNRKYCDGVHATRLDGYEVLYKDEDFIRILNRM